jgi:hypothetical protein
MGQDALPALRQAAENDTDAEVQWRARRLIRQIERGDSGGLGRREQGGRQADEPRDPLRTRAQAPWTDPWGTDVQERFDRLFRDLERDFGMDVPRSRFFDDSFFKDLQEQMQEMQQRMQGLQQGGTAGGQSMSMQVGPDGVRVELKRKNEKGEEEKQVYEAPDLQTFEQKYPGVLQQHGLGGRFLFRGPFGGDFLRIEPMPLRRGQAAPPDAPEALDPVVVPPPGKRLGVVVKQEIPAEVRSYLGLDDDVGLMVEQVQDGTLAKQLGIEPEDIVLKIAGRQIHGIPDVQEALGSVAAGGTVEVVLLRRGKQLEVRGSKPADEPEPAKGLEPRK